MENNSKSGPKSKAPKSSGGNQSKQSNNTNSRISSKSSPRPETYPTKENERDPGVKRTNLPHDPIKGGSKNKK